MEIIRTNFDGLILIQPQVFIDPRGYFFESYKHDTFLKAGIDFNPVQDNESKSIKGVVRGLHYQLQPYDQAKLIRVVVGEILDVAVDIRIKSATYGKWYSIELSSKNRTQLFIPKGFAHGYSVVSETAVIHYKCDNSYNPQFERGISLKDPFLNINWKLENINPIISDKDLKHPYLNDAENNF